MRLGVIADDLTGANDTGVQFARQGARTLVPLDWHDLNSLARSADVLVLSTNSRAVSPRVAAQRARVAAEALRCAGVQAIYKKIDSTFRGTVGAELEAILDVFPSPLTVLTPAFPPAGREVKNGLLLVGGVPVHRTAAGQDPVTPVREAHLPTLLRRQCRCPIYALPIAALRGQATVLGRTFKGWRGAPGIVVADAVTAADLKRLGRAITREALFGVAAGSAGLAGALSEILKWPRRVRPRQTAAREPIVLVIGSANPTSLDQIAWIEGRGHAHVVRADLAEVVADSGRYRKELLRVVDAAHAAMREGRHTVLTLQQRSTPRGLPPSASKTLSEFLGHASHLVLRKARPGGILFCGGDITLAACSALGAQGLELAGEIEPGVPWGRLVGGEFGGLPTVTKAGGFGKPQTFARVIRFLHPGRTRRSNGKKGAA